MLIYKIVPAIMLIYSIYLMCKPFLFTASDECAISATNRIVGLLQMIVGIVMGSLCVLYISGGLNVDITWINLVLLSTIILVFGASVADFSCQNRNLIITEGVLMALAALALLYWIFLYGKLGHAQLLAKQFPALYK